VDVTDDTYDSDHVDDTDDTYDSDTRRQ